MTVPANLQEFAGRSSLAPRAGAGPPAMPSGSLGQSEGPLNLLWEGLDVLQRPMRMVSESYGELAQGEGDVLEALSRGFSGEYEFGTLGEQLFPVSVGTDYDPAEEWGKKAARLAVDIATDPLTYVALGPLRGAVGAGLKGTRAVTKKLPWPQWMAIATLPSVSVLKHYGKVGGKEAAKGINRMYVGSKLKSAQRQDALKKILEKVGLNRRKDELTRSQASHWIETGATRHGVPNPDPKIGEMAEWLSKQHDDMAGEVERFRDTFGKPFKVVHPTLQSAQKEVGTLTGKLGLGSAKHKETREKIWEAVLSGEGFEGSAGAQTLHKAVNKRLKGYTPEVLKEGPNIWGGEEFYIRSFQRQRDYVPWMLKDDVLQMFGTEKGFSKAVDQLAVMNGITKMEAKGILQKFATPQKAGQLEFAREFKMPEAWIERDPLKFFPRYVEKLYGRMEFAKEFGFSGAKLKGYLDDAVVDGLDSKFATDLLNVAMGKMPRDPTLDRIARKVMAFQVFTKMGPLSTLANLTQNWNTIIREGGIKFVKGVLRSQTDEGARAGIVAYQRGIHDDLMRLMGGENAWSSRYLEWVGFNPVERMNRLLAANAGIVSTESMIRQAGKMTDDLARRHITNDDIMKTIANAGKMPVEIADKVGFLASEATQHATHWKDIPLWWQSPVWRTAFQYKSFVYQQTRFLMREIMSPAVKYFESGGKKGSVAPLLRAAVGFGVSAEVVNYIRQTTRQYAGKLVGIEYEPPPFDEEHPIWQLMQHSMYVGGVGIAGDLVDRAMQRDLKGWLLGPTAGDISDLAEGGMRAVRAAGDESERIQWHKLFGQIQRRTPFVGTILPRGKETTRKWEDILSAVR